MLKNVQKEKEQLEESFAASQSALENLEKKLKESEERERMIIEYPDLNGPVNQNLQGMYMLTLN